MPDPDAVKQTGALKRSSQLAALRAVNAARTAQTLRQNNNVLAGRPRDWVNPQRQQPYNNGKWAGLTPQQVRRPRYAAPPPKPHSPSRHADDPRDLLGLGLFNQPKEDDAPYRSHFFDNYMRDLDPETRIDSQSTWTTDPKTGERLNLPGRSLMPAIHGDAVNRDKSEIDRYAKLTPAERAEVRKNVEQGNSPAKTFDKTIGAMLDLINKDPLNDPDRKAAGKDIADAFRDMAHAKYFTNDELTENPFLGTLNELAVWADFRLRLQDFADNKRKTGDTQLGDEDSGDGSYASATADVGSFGQATTSGNLSKWLVARDEHGLLQVVSADQWIQAKFARMRHDPKYAAQMITALAVTSAYGSDSTANSQRSRLVIGKGGNPVKGFVSAEDLKALKELANQVAILQNQGDEVAIDDSIAELSKTAFDVTAGAQAAGDFGSDYGRGGGYRHYGGGGGGYGGYGGGGGGGSGAVRYTDGTQLTSMVSSISRQRMGRELTPEEAAAFVAYYHGLEEQSSAQYYAGQSNTQLDPEGQAVAWVTSHFNEESAKNQYGNLAAEFFSMMGGSNPFGGIAG